MPRILRSLADLSEIETTYEATGFAPLFDKLLDGSYAALIVVIAAHELDTLDGTATCFNARCLAAQADEAGDNYSGAKVFAEALDVPYSQVLGLIDGWNDLYRDLDSTDELPLEYQELLNDGQYGDYWDLAQMLRMEIIVISLRRHADDLKLTEAEVKEISGCSNDLSIENTEEAIVYMLQHRGWDKIYIADRFSHEAYRKSGGRLDFTDWQASGEPSDLDEEIKNSANDPN